MEQGVRQHTGAAANLSSIAMSSPRSYNWMAGLMRLFPEIYVSLSYILSTAGFLGVVGNILVMLGFSRMGFSNTIHISYTALALSDLLTSLGSIMKGLIPMVAMLQRVDPKIYRGLETVLGTYTNYAFSKISFLLMAWISFERCLCVLLPTHVKVLINRLVTKIAIVACFLLALVPMTIRYLSFTYELQIDSARNTSRLVLTYNAGIGQGPLQQIASFLLGIVYPFISCGVVTLSTLTLVIKLKQSARWRQRNATVDNAQAQVTKETAAPTNEKEPKNRVMSTKEARVTRVVVMVASAFLICSLPIVAQILALATVPDYNSAGRLRLLNKVNIMIVYIATQLNSTLNLVIFTASMEKFRSALIEILTGKCCKR